MLVGLLKAGLGLGLRPAAGIVEGVAKVLVGFGLLCLGKRGIQGRLTRRVQAPGMAITDVVQVGLCPNPVRLAVSRYV